MTAASESYVPLPLDTLPCAVGNYVTELAESIRSDAAAVAVPVLACVAGAVGTKRILRLPDGRIEPATIWGAVIDEGGAALRQAFEPATAIVRRKQLEAFARFDAAIQEYKSQLEKIRTVRAYDDDSEPRWPPVA
jgi:hypothetical protein